MQAKIIKIMEPEVAEKYRLQLEDMDWQVGKARTDQLTGSIKKNKELKPNEDGDDVKLLSNKLCKLTTANKDFQAFTQMRQMTAYKFNNYDEPGGAYNRHTDAPWMGPVRTDFTAVLCLTDPDTYKGGDHWVQDPINGPQSFRPQAGELMIYETGYAHWVDPVEEGSRISALSWVESQVEDERQRGLLVTLRGLSQTFEQGMFNDEASEEERELMRNWFVDIGVVHSGLYRMWANR